MKCFEKFPIIKTERLTLRQIKAKDLRDLNDMINDFEMKKYWGYYDPETGTNYLEFEDESKSYVENVLSEYKKRSELRFIIDMKGKAIGEVILYDFLMGRQAEIGYRVNRQYWGQGIAYEASKAVTDYAFNQLGLQRIVLRCFAENTPSKKLAEKLGFTLEGKIRKGLVIKVFTDHYIFGKLRTDKQPLL